MTTQAEKCQQFAQLHQQAGGFVIPNPWDAGSARILQGLGFKALATTSAGFAFTSAKVDGQVTLEEKLAHCQSLCEATDIPINADFENGFADDPATVYQNVLKVAATGVAGCSIEDYSRDGNRIYPLDLAVERVQAAVEAVATLGMPFQLTARAENLLRGINDLDNTIQRLQAYQSVGANVLYAPGLKTLEQLKNVTDEISRPFNVLSVFFRDTTVDDFVAVGAKRISLGGALTWASIKPLLDAGKEMLEKGSFNWTKQLASGAEVKNLLNT
jgi:2-methylisocitrate lyase-like PEP mutase family enzyme